MSSTLNPCAGGVTLQARPGANLSTDVQTLTAWLEDLALWPCVEITQIDQAGLSVTRFALKVAWRDALMPDYDTSQLMRRLNLNAGVAGSDLDLDREILLSMLGGPLTFEFPTLAELQAHVQVRRHVVRASEKTALAFATDAAERPQDCWHYAPGCGFLLRPGHELVESLIKATQPGVSGTMYSFSCYRATEYVMLLGLAMALQTRNPVLLRQLEQQWRQRAIMSAEFHERFLHEFGTVENPLPMRYYVPGDRLWFRNPDNASAEVTGYEGSWVIYLGQGLFSDFWRSERRYTLESKCLEIFHWRNGLVFGPDGSAQMDEAIVNARVAQSVADPQKVQGILGQMMRYRAPRGRPGSEGGCIDATREFLRRLCPGTAEIQLPGH